VSAEILRVREEGGVLTLLMNRPEKRNALSGALVSALTLALNDARERKDVRVILLRGAGPDFCAGADLEELEGMLDQSPGASLEDARHLGALLLSMRRHPKPIVAAVQGRALAGGCGLATACDLVLAREDAELGYPEVHIGFVPAMVMAILRRKLTEGRAFELVVMGQRISAVEAHRIGLVNRVLPVEDFELQVGAFASELAKRPTSAATLTKSLLYEQGDLTVAEGVERGAQVNVEARQTDACRNGVRAFLDRKRGGSR
jgi:methylglutaconyl-CoA hydratase